MNALHPRLHRRRNAVLAVCLLVWVAAPVITRLPPPAIGAALGPDALLHAVGSFVLASLRALTLAARGVSRRPRIVTVLLIAAVEPILAPRGRATRP